MLAVHSQGGVVVVCRKFFSFARSAPPHVLYATLAPVDDEKNRKAKKVSRNYDLVRLLCFSILIAPAPFVAVSGLWLLSLHGMLLVQFDVTLRCSRGGHMIT